MIDAALWGIKKGDTVEVNGRRLKVTEVREIASCDPDHAQCEDEKTFYLGRELALCVSESGVQLFKVGRPDKNTKELTRVPLDGIRVLEPKKK